MSASQERLVRGSEAEGEGRGQRERHRALPLLAVKSKIIKVSSTISIYPGNSDVFTCGKQFPGLKINSSLESG